MDQHIQEIESSQTALLQSSVHLVEELAKLKAEVEARRKNGAAGSNS